MQFLHYYTYWFLFDFMYIMYHKLPTQSIPHLEYKHSLDIMNHPKWSNLTMLFIYYYRYDFLFHPLRIK